MIDVTAQNEASLELAQQLNGEGIRQAEIGDAIRKTVEILSPQEEQTATVAVTSGSDSKAEQLRQEVSRELETSGAVQFEAHTASKEERRAAQERGMSTGRYQSSRRDGTQKKDPAASGAPTAEDSGYAVPDPMSEQSAPGKEEAAPERRTSRQEDLPTEAVKTQSGQAQEVPPVRQDSPVQQESRPESAQLPEGSGAEPQAPSFQESGPVGADPGGQPNAAPAETPAQQSNTICSSRSTSSTPAVKSPRIPPPSKIKPTDSMKLAPFVNGIIKRKYKLKINEERD